MKKYDAKPLPPLDPAMDMSKNHYWSYQGLDTLLACKKPLTASKDEDLFIAVHQICEIAFHQIILDLDRTLDALKAAFAAPARPVGELDEALYFLDRPLKLWDSVNRTMPILGDMRGFAEFRTSIGPSSGFQSFQFRRIEIMAGVEKSYWTGGTADAAGKVHVAESEFDKHYGGQVRAAFERYRDHSLRHYFETLLARAPAESREERVAWLDANENAAPLMDRLRQYEARQATFHQAHLGLAARQLAIVGVEVGTGGSAFKDYLAKYNREVAPLFPGLASPFAAE
jgi:tryptophan 2,3-dioxygenase